MQFGLFAGLFLAYLGVAVYGSDPAWTTRQLLRQPAGQAGLVLISALMTMTFGQVRAAACCGLVSGPWRSLCAVVVRCDAAHACASRLPCVAGRSGRRRGEADGDVPQRLLDVTLELV